MFKVKTLSPSQTIATCPHNKSQHCWAQHFACVWPPCCDMLGVVDSNLTSFKFEPTTPNMSQHIATRWPNARNMLHPTMLRRVAFACCDRLAGALAVLFPPYPREMKTNTRYLNLPPFCRLFVSMEMVQPFPTSALSRARGLSIRTHLTAVGSAAR